MLADDVRVRASTQPVADRGPAGPASSAVSGAPAERRWTAGMRRSVTLFQAFRKEQTDPDLFYGMLAADSAAQVAHYAPLAGRLVLDVGGGPGYFADSFRRAGARYLAIDSDVGEMSLHGRAPERGTSILGSGLSLPIRDGAVDVCYSSNVLEHVPDPWRMADEMVRVTRPGGYVFLSFTSWLSPWGGHETSPWHYLGGRLRGAALCPPARQAAEERLRREPVRCQCRGRPRVGPLPAQGRRRRRPTALPPEVGETGPQGSRAARDRHVEPAARPAPHARLTAPPWTPRSRVLRHGVAGTRRVGPGTGGPSDTMAQTPQCPTSQEPPCPAP